MQNAGLNESLAGIKIARRNINSLRYAGDIILMAESEEELKSLLKLKQESEKADLKINIQNAKIMTPDPISSCQIEEGKSENSDRSYFLGLQYHFRWWL